MMKQYIGKSKQKSNAALLTELWLYFYIRKLCVFSSTFNCQWIHFNFTLAFTEVTEIHFALTFFHFSQISLRVSSTDISTNRKPNVNFISWERRAVVNLLSILVVVICWISFRFTQLYMWPERRTTKTTLRQHVESPTHRGVVSVGRRSSRLGFGSTGPRWARRLQWLQPVVYAQSLLCFRRTVSRTRTWGV